jgi:succinate dehydrogenase hydrophobic anchor subunit
MRDRTLWIVQTAAAGIVLLLLAGHMAVMHLDPALGIGNPAGGRPVDWANVMARGRSAAFLVGYVLLLAAALIHGLLGLRGILLELDLPSAAARALGALLVVVGASLLVLGGWAAWAGFHLARGA